MEEEKKKKTKGKNKEKLPFAVFVTTKSVGNTYEDYKQIFTDIISDRIMIFLGIWFPLSLQEYSNRYDQKRQENDKKTTKKKITEEVLIEFCSTERTLKEVVEHLGYKDVANFKDRYINSLLINK